MHMIILTGILEAAATLRSTLSSLIPNAIRKSWPSLIGYHQAILTEPLRVCSGHPYPYGTSLPFSGNETGSRSDMSVLIFRLLPQILKTLKGLLLRILQSLTQTMHSSQRH